VGISDSDQVGAHIKQLVIDPPLRRGSLTKARPQKTRLQAGRLSTAPFNVGPVWDDASPN